MTDPSSVGQPDPTQPGAPAGAASGAGAGAASEQVAAGWYPDPATGQLRWWDGVQWGAFAQQPAPGYGVPAAYQPAASTQSPTTMAMLAHLLGLLFGFIGPLIIYLTAGNQDPFVKDQSGEALNFQLTILIASLVSFVLMFVLIGFVLIFAVIIVNWIFCIMAAMAANRGEWYRYPINLRMVH